MTNQKLINSSVLKQHIKSNLPDFKSGSEVEVHYKIIEGSKSRIQIFKGIVISRKGGNSLDASFTVLRNSTAGIKVERTFPLHSPNIEKIVVVNGIKRAIRSKLYSARKLKNPLTTKTKTLKAKLSA